MRFLLCWLCVGVSLTLVLCAQVHVKLWSGPTAKELLRVRVPSPSTKTPNKLWTALNVSIDEVKRIVYLPQHHSLFCCCCWCFLLMCSPFSFSVIPKCFLMKAEMYRARNNLGTRTLGGKPVETAFVDNDGIYDPECDVTGTFKARQCNNTEECWCVNSAGVRRTDKEDKNIKCDKLVETLWVTSSSSVWLTYWNQMFRCSTLTCFISLQLGSTSADSQKGWQTSECWQVEGVSIFDSPHIETQTYNYSLFNRFLIVTLFSIQCHCGCH